MNSLGDSKHVSRLDILCSETMVFKKAGRIETPSVRLTVVAALSSTSRRRLVTRPRVTSPTMQRHTYPIKWLMFDDGFA